MKGFVFCSGSQQFANLPFLFLELMDEAFLIFFIQAGKSFQELHPLQDASPASHCPQALSPFSTCEVEYSSPPHSQPDPASCRSTRGWYARPGRLGLLSQQLSALPHSVCVLFSSWFLTVFLFLSPFFPPLPPSLLLNWLCILFYCCVLLRSISVVFSWINSISVWRRR